MRVLNAAKGADPVAALPFAFKEQACRTPPLGARTAPSGEMGMRLDGQLPSCTASRLLLPDLARAKSGRACLPSGRRVTAPTPVRRGLISLRVVTGPRPLLNGFQPYEQRTENRCPQRFFSVRARMTEGVREKGVERKEKESVGARKG